MKNILIAFLLFITTNCIYSQTTTIYLIRHSEKVNNSKNPDLSNEGLARAQHWKMIFKAVPITAIYSTDYLRTVQTATPTANDKNLTIVKYDPKTIDIEKLKKDHLGQSILIVGHSNTTPYLVNTIINEKVYAAITDTVFGNLYIITINDARLSHILLQDL